MIRLIFNKNFVEKESLCGSHIQDPQIYFIKKKLSLKLVYSNVHIFKKLFCYVISDSQPNSRTIEKLAYG